MNRWTAEDEAFYGTWLATHRYEWKPNDDVDHVPGGPTLPAQFAALPTAAGSGETRVTNPERLEP